MPEPAAYPRACLKIHSSHLHPLICGIFLPNSVNVARYASFIWQKSPTNCRIHLSESNFQTRSSQLPQTRFCCWHCSRRYCCTSRLC
ncbi:DUF6783 domain-containing protein [Lachnospiraceae bacterium JLR.KK009]